MSFTGQLGTALSQPGQILLGSTGSSPLNVTVSDSLNSWNDSTISVLSYNIQKQDTFALSDSIRVVLGLHKSLSDSADNYADVIDTRLINFLRLSVSDTLNFWADQVSRERINVSVPQLIYKPNEVEYIRRYLNDVVIEDLGTFTPSTQVIYKADEITYIRRYLNDV